MMKAYPFALIEEGYHYDTKFFESADDAIEYAAKNTGEYELKDETIWVDVRVEVDLDVMAEIIMDRCPTTEIEEIHPGSYMLVTGTSIDALEQLKQVCPPETDIRAEGFDIELDFDTHLRWETVRVDPPEPECLDGYGHDWRAPYEVVGGFKDNPGVWGSGGGVLIKEVCAHCGMYRLTDTWAQNPDTGEQGLEAVIYAEADDISKAWIGQDEDD